MALVRIDNGSFGMTLQLMRLCTVRAYATRKHFNFPFWKPKETFNPNVLKVMGATIIEGRLARIFWHSARTSLYALVAGPIFSSIITSSWAITTAAAGRMKDPRTRDMFQAMREQHRQVMRQRQESLGQRRQMNTPTSRNASTGSQSSTNNEFGDSFSPDQPTFDPDSPQAGSAEYTNYNTYPSTNDDSSSSSSPSNRTFSSRSSPLNNRPTKSQNTPPFPREPERQDEQNMSSGFFDTPYDDASPATSNSTPFSSSASSPSSSSSSSGGGNAWERLRSGASNNSSNSQGEDAPTNQEEFDAKIERERRGRDF